MVSSGCRYGGRRYTTCDDEAALSGRRTRDFSFTWVTRDDQASNTATHVRSNTHNTSSREAHTGNEVEVTMDEGQGNLMLWIDIATIPSSLYSLPHQHTSIRLLHLFSSQHRSGNTSFDIDSRLSVPYCHDSSRDQHIVSMKEIRSS
jgi:hypothetical protein